MQDRESSFDEVEEKEMQQNAEFLDQKPYQEQNCVDVMANPELDQVSRFAQDIMSAHPIQRASLNEKIELLSHQAPTHC